MTDSNVIFEHSFPGVGYPTFAVEWPNFSWPTGNPTGWSKPVVDGHNHGMGSRTHRPLSTRPWRAKSDYYPGSANYKVDWEVRWADPTNGLDTIGLIVRFVDYDNLIVARIKCGVTPELTLWKVVAGTATQLGSAYTGTGISSLNLFSGVKIRVRVEDRADDTQVIIYTGSTDSDNGTARITQTLDVTGLRGAYTCGIELIETLNDRVFINSVKCRDFADEWTPGDATPGEGWKVELGGILYSMEDLDALDPSVELLEVKHGYGLSGVEAKIAVQGDYRLGSVLFPGQRIRIFESGTCIFNGEVAEADGSASPNSEQQVFNCRDGRWASKKVILEADDLTGSHYFNVYATAGDADSDACSGTVQQNYPDEYDPDLQDMTIGEIIGWLFDRYVDGDFGLRYYGAAPASGLPYVQSELDAMIAVMPDIVVHGTFPQAIDALLKYQPLFHCIVDPDTLVWHFRNVTSLTADTIAMPTDMVTSLKVRPDPDKCITAVVWRGTKKQDADLVELSLSEGTLVPAWTADQEAIHSDKKKNLHSALLTVASAGTLASTTYKGKVYLALDYIDISLTQSADLQVDPDDWRGSTLLVSGQLRFVIGNTATRFYLSAPNWSSAPSPGTQVTIGYNDECAQEGLSAAGVGRGFYLKRPGEICGIGLVTPNAYKSNMKNKGFCGKALVTATGFGASGVTFAQEYEFRVRMMTEQAQSAFGTCDPLLLISKPIEKPLGLVNYGLLPPSKGSAPATKCQTNSPIPGGVDLKVIISETEAEAAYQRWPAEGFRGPAYSEDETAWGGGGDPRADDWKVRNTLIIDDPDFKSLAIQGPGILEAQKAIVTLFGQKAYAVEVQLAAGWQLDDVDVPMLTSRFSLLSKKLRLTSTKRNTGFETVDCLPIYEVRWNVRERITSLRAGTPVAWSGLDPKSLANAFVDKNMLKKIYQKMKEVEDFRNALIAHAASRSGSSPLSTDGCTVSYSNNDTREFKDMNTAVVGKDRKISNLAAGRQLSDVLMFKRDADNPGSPISIPALTDAASKMPIRSAAVLESAAKPWALEQGPAGVLNSDRSRYGGLTGRDEATSGNPPTELGRFGGYSWRLAPDAEGNAYGGAKLQFAALGTTGAPGSYTDFVGPESMPNGHVPLSVIGVGTLLHTILSRVEGVEQRVGALADATTELPVTPGDVTAEYADGAPPSLIDTAIAMLNFQGSQLLLSTIDDPGGPVFTGPRGTLGVDSQTYWRLAMPERVVYQVSAVTAGTGQNGGDWDEVLVSGHPVYADVGSIYHKQAHCADLHADDAADIAAAATIHATDDSPYGFANARGWDLSPTVLSGVGTIFAMPRGAVGIPIFEAILTEVPGETSSPAQKHSVRFSYSYKASAWTSKTDTTAAVAITGDSSGEVVGRYLVPGGAVPAGLRPPSDVPTMLALSLRRTPGSGLDTASGKGTTVVGIGVTMAIIEGGIWVRVREGVDIAEAMTNNHPQSIEVADIAESVALECGKVLPEAVSIGDSASLQLNPPLVLGESPAADDAVVLDFTKANTEAAGAADSTVLQLNP